MLRTTITITALLSLCQIVTAVRNTDEIIDFQILHQEPCMGEYGWDRCDPNNPVISRNPELSKSLTPRGNGNMCRTGICGRFLGKDNMCCVSKDPRGYNLIRDTYGFEYVSVVNKHAHNVTIQQSVDSMREGCEQWMTTLAEYDIDSKNNKPTSEGCDMVNWTTEFPLGFNTKTCCSVENDGITLFSAEQVYDDKAVCIPPLGRLKNATTTDTPAKKNGASGWASSSLVALVVVGFTLARAVL